MSITLIAISVGNSRTQIGSFDGTNLLASHTIANDALNTLPGLLAELGEAPAIFLSSVNEPVAERISAMIEADLVRVERDVNIPIGRKLDVESIVGEDRLLNAAAAFDQIKQAVIIVDAGTALTVDFVDGEGTFHGGAILPGARMMLRAMHEYTAQLPLIDLAEPDEPIGHSTRQAMLTGVVNGLRGAVRELVEKFAEVYRGYPKVIATGGDAALLFERYDLIEAIVPDLTLRGMALTHRTATSQSE